MKLKERPLEWWKGRKFTYWCRADVNDERKINYTLNLMTVGGGTQVYYFSSEDVVGFDVLSWLRSGRINDLRFENDEWFVTIDAVLIKA